MAGFGRKQTVVPTSLSSAPASPGCSCLETGKERIDSFASHLQDEMSLFYHTPQGGILSAALLGMQSDGVALTKVPKIKYLIIMSGGKLRGTGSKFCTPKLAANAFSTPVRCLSLHIIGEADFFKESGIELLDAFVDPLVIHHQKGHTIARLDEKGLKTMLSFIEKIEKM